MFNDISLNVVLSFTCHWESLWRLLPFGLLGCHEVSSEEYHRGPICDPLSFSISGDLLYDFSYLCIHAFSPLVDILPVVSWNQIRCFDLSKTKIITAGSDCCSANLILRLDVIIIIIWDLGCCWYFRQQGTSKVNVKGLVLILDGICDNSCHQFQPTFLTFPCW